MTDLDTIDSFTGQYAFLSNFYVKAYTSNKVRYLTAEHYYQAQKTDDNYQKQQILAARTPKMAKRLGRKCTLVSDWEAIKLDVMRDALFFKFTEGSRLAKALIETHPKILVEGNTWGDMYWGICNGVGENWLGKLLMERRDELMS